MKPDPNVPVHGTDGVHADTKTRDANFVMSGHHCHTCFELFYVESGCCRFLIDDSIQDLHAGDVILVPLMALHYTRYVFGTCRRTVILFRREDVLDEIRRSMPGGDRIFTETTVFQVPPAYRGQVAHCIKHMIAEEHLQDSRSFLMRKIYLNTAAVVLALILGPIGEKGLRNALRTSRGDIGVLFSSVVCWVLIALCIFGILSPIFMNKLEKNAEKEAAEATGADVEELTEEDSV